ncbi:MAG: hypothetical protein NZ853_07025 [Leptospiraceae bacterium]|nr:hypothetical protein [Leptospiraceae bacterium]MDW7975814.1 tetratricopeptide repeat protein [Leptospiraceae bacterium]
MFSFHYNHIGSIVRFLTLTAIVFTFSYCATAVSIKFPQFPEGTKGQKLRSVLDGKKKVAVIAKEPPPAIRRSFDRLGLASELNETMRAAMKTKLQQYGYYTVLDIDSRNERYQELARTQTGITQAQKRLGLELEVDHLIFVNMTAIPRVECKVELITDAVAAAAVALQLALAASGVEVKIDNTTTSRPTGVLYLTVFLEGTIVNVETGKSISHSVQKPVRLANQAGNIQCPSELVAFNQALDLATTEIANVLSPQIITLDIPLESKDNVKIGDKKMINQLLVDGIRWIEAGDVEQAIKSWEEALTYSGGTSKSALWNIAIAHWYSGNMEEAQKYFDLTLKIGGPNFFNSEKRRIYAIFKQEKRRIEEEG